MTWHYELLSTYFPKRVQLWCKFHTPSGRFWCHFQQNPIFACLNFYEKKKLLRETENPKSGVSPSENDSRTDLWFLLPESLVVADHILNKPCIRASKMWTTSNELNKYRERIPREPWAHHRLWVLLRGWKLIKRKTSPAYYSIGIQCWRISFQINYIYLERLGKKPFEGTEREESLNTGQK